MIKDLIIKNRTYRRFYQNVEITEKELLEFIDLARLSSTGANMQQLKYIVSHTAEKNEMIFRELKWACLLYTSEAETVSDGR